MSMMFVKAHRRGDALVRAYSRSGSVIQAQRNVGAMYRSKVAQHKKARGKNRADLLRVVGNLSQARMRLGNISTKKRKIGKILMGR